MIRSKSDITPQYVISIGLPTRSEVPGFDQIMVTFSAGGTTSRPLTFLLSTDGKTLAQFNKFDLSQDPKDKVAVSGRPARGGPESAPVVVVGFDDLECPYCAMMHAELFPAIVDRYKNQVRVVYRDFPLDQHVWAMRAAVDANCLAAASPAGYWNFVDFVHAHAAEIGGDEKIPLAKANQTLDKLAADEGARQKVNQPELAACITKQDDTKIKASVKEGEALGVDATPTFFINGEKVADALGHPRPMDYIYGIIDAALTAAGQTPPPPPPAPPPPASSAPPAPPATKPGS